MQRRSERALLGAATLLAVGLGVAFFFSGYQTLIYDAWAYSELARRLSRGGLLAAAYELRTYGYPLFVALVSGFQQLDSSTIRLLVFLVQLAIYVAACAAGARILGAVYGSRRFARMAYLVTVLNPFLLARTTETLSDLLSAVLVYLGVVLSLPRKDARLNRVTPRAAASLFCLAFGTMVRPSNVVVLLAVAIVWLARAALWRDLNWRAAPLLLAVVVLPFLPQLTVNYRVFGKVQPLIAQSLYWYQERWGLAGLKYGTLVRSGEHPELLYKNPLYRGEPRPSVFLRERPVAYAATLALHLFAMFDHDFVMTYPTVRHPWHRWPLSIVNYVFLFLCLAGIALFFRDGRSGLHDSERFAGFALLFATAASLALYLPILVESRFSAPAELLLTPFLVGAVMRVAELSARRDTKRLVAWALAGALFVGSCALLSAWVAAQAPQLVDEGGTSAPMDRGPITPIPRPTY